MSASSQSMEPYYLEFLRCAKCSHDFEHENPSYHPITLPICGHTMCRQCIDIICNQTKCPQDEISFGINNTPIDQLPINYPLLILLYESSKLPERDEQRYGQCLSYRKLDDQTKERFNTAQNILGNISNSIKPIINDKECQSILSRSVIRKIFRLLNSQYIVHEGRLKAIEAARSLGQWTCINFINFNHSYQNPQQLNELKVKLSSALHFRGFEYLEPAMQENVLKLILSVVKDGQMFYYSDLISNVVQQVTTEDPVFFYSKVDSVVQLLCHASCFEEEALEDNLRLQLKSEFRNYGSLRREQDSQIIQIAMDAGFRLLPEQWCCLLYGDTQRESRCVEGIIDKLSTASFDQAIQDFVNMIKSDAKRFIDVASLKYQFEVLANSKIEKNDETKQTESSKAAVIEQENELNLINVHDEMFFADDDPVVYEDDDPIVYEDDDPVVYEDDDLIVNKDDLVLNEDDDLDEMPVVQIDNSDHEQEIYSISRHSSETQLKLQIALFIRKANINKKNSNALLNLIRRTSTIEIPSNCDKLWTDLNVKFSYKTIIYCSSCSRKLRHIKERCSNDECQHQIHKINSELILFDIADEIRSITAKNYPLIKWYQENPQNGPPCDILFGDFYRNKFSKNCLSLMLSTDGKPLTVLTKSSIWRVVAALAEIPHPVREYY